MRNGLSIDFEDWFQPFARRGVRGWERFPSRVPEDTRRLLALFRRHDVRCTFFVLGEVAEKFPEQIRAIHADGHEIGSHGYRHVPLFEQERAQFEAEMRGTLDLLANLTGEPVRGFRAPFFSIREGSLWAIDSLRALGLEYDSSINPIAGALHGYRNGSRVPYHHDNGLRELPITTLAVGRTAVPFGGGFYYRMLPYRLIRAGLARLNRQGMPANIYFHPRELDPDLPRLQVGIGLRMMAYAGTAALESKLDRLLQDFEFVPLREL